MGNLNVSGLDAHIGQRQERERKDRREGQKEDKSQKKGRHRVGRTVYIQPPPWLSYPSPPPPLSCLTTGCQEG